jgi:hypothetical protein
VPLARLQSAETWVREHMKAFHLQREAQELERLRARSGAPRARPPRLPAARPRMAARPLLGLGKLGLGYARHDCESRKSRTCSSDFLALPSGLEAQLLERGPTLQASVEVVEERPLRIGLTAQRWRAAD